MGDKLPSEIFNAELIALCVAKLKTGKSPRIDGLTCEHLTHCHPVIYSILAKLFNMMTVYSYVPSAFGVGITIPIPKEDSTRGPQKIESFRGITLSPVMSKALNMASCITMANACIHQITNLASRAKLDVHMQYTLCGM